MHGAVAEQRWVDFDIPAPLPQVCSHIPGVDTDGSAISWGKRRVGARGFEADAENCVLDPFVAERILLPLRLRSATAYVRTHVMICVEANFPPTCVRSAHVWTYLKGLTSGMRKCYENSNCSVQFISNHILPHRLNINNSCTQWYSCGSSIVFLNMNKNPTSVLFSSLNKANMVPYIFEAVIDVKCQLVDV